MKKIHFLLLTGLCAAFTTGGAQENHLLPGVMNDTAQATSADPKPTGARRKIARASREKSEGARTFAKKLRAELKGLSPAEKRVRLQEVRSQTISILKTKQADGTITGREQNRLDRAEKRPPRFQRAIGPEPKVEAKAAVPAP